MQKTNPHITIIEDDELLRLSLSNFFKQQGYVVSDFASAVGVVEFIKQGDSDIVLCDVMLPDINGLELVQQLRQVTDAGIIFISGKTALEDRISGLSLGADDYICKPIDLTELALRTTSLLSRLNHCSPARFTKESTSFTYFFDLKLNIETRLLSSESIIIELGENEFDLLCTLLNRQGKICSRQHIITQMSNGSTYVEGRGLDQLITRLRKKITHISANPNNIITYRGRGYMLPLN